MVPREKKMLERIVLSTQLAAQTIFYKCFLFLISFNKIRYKPKLRVEDFILAHILREKEHHAGEFMTVGKWGSWSHCIH